MSWFWNQRLLHFEKYVHKKDQLTALKLPLVTPHLPKKGTSSSKGVEIGVGVSMTFDSEDRMKVPDYPSIITHWGAPHKTSRYGGLAHITTVHLISLSRKCTHNKKIINF